MMLSRRHVVVLALLATSACKKEAPPPAGAAALGSAVPAASGAATAPAAGNSLAILEGFEGEVTLHAKGKASAKDATAKDVNLALRVKDGKFRVDLPEELTGSRELGTAFVIVKPTEKKLVAVMAAKKQAVQLDFDKLAAQAKAMSGMHRPGAAAGGAAAPAPVVQKTGKTDTVAGYACEIWHIAQGNQAGDLCIGSQGAAWFHLPLAGLPAEFAWASEITDGQHFPLRLVVSENGVEQGRLEVTSIQKKPLPAADFEVPAGFNVMDLDQMMGAMMHGMAGMPPGAMGMPPGAMGMPPGATPKPKHK